MTRTEPATVADVELVTHGHVPPELVEYARDKVLQVGRYAGEPILHVRIKLMVPGDPALSRPALAQANLDINGRLLRGHAAAPTMREAIDLLQARLRHRLSRTALLWEARRRPTRVPAEQSSRPPAGANRGR